MKHLIIFLMLLPATVACQHSSKTVTIDRGSATQQIGSDESPLSGASDGEAIVLDGDIVPNADRSMVIVIYQNDETGQEVAPQRQGSILGAGVKSTKEHVEPDPADTEEEDPVGLEEAPIEPKKDHVEPDADEDATEAP